MRIKVNEKVLEIKNFYPYRYSDGKLVIRFDVSNKVADFNSLYELLNENQYPIEYYENDEEINVTCVYHGYSEFTAQYSNGIYHVEQVTPSTLQSQIDDLISTTKAQAEIINNQNMLIENLSDCIIEMSIELYN